MSNPASASTTERAQQIAGEQLEEPRWGHDEHFRFSNWPAVAFDLDHTLARYRLPNLHRLCYDRVVAYLSRNEYSDIAFRPFGEIDMKFAQRGIYYDKQRGVVMKLDGKGDIAQAYHGTSPLIKEEIEDIYAGCSQLITLKHGPFLKPEESSVTQPTIHCFDDHFTIGTIYLLMELVQLYLDGKKIHYGFERPFRHIMQAYGKIFAQEDFRLGRAGFFSALREEPNVYLHRLSYEFLRFMKRLKTKNIAIIVITNSAPDFANFVLNYVIGQSWKKMVDAVIFDAKKPYFFTYTARQFYWVDEKTWERKGAADPKNFKAPLYVSQGSMNEMKNVIKAVNGHLTHHMIYVGDSLVGDIYASSLTKSCAIIAVTEELEERLQSEWGPMLGTTDNPSFWRKKLEEWSTALLHSVEDLAKISPSENVKVSTTRFQIINRGEAVHGAS